MAKQKDATAVGRDPCTPAELLAALKALDRHDGAIDEDARLAIEAPLFAAFVASPEAASLEEPGFAQNLLHFSANYRGETIATMGPSGLREAVFEWIPRKVVVEPAEAPAIIEECRAFYVWLGRAAGLPQAAECLRVLDGDAAKRLAAALGDPRKFGMAKSFFAGGGAAGFDLRSEEGPKEWIATNLAGGLAGAPLDPARPRTKPGDAGARAKKQQRKAAKEARRKNRSRR